MGGNVPVRRTVVNERREVPVNLGSGYNGRSENPVCRNPFPDRYLPPCAKTAVDVGTKGRELIDQRQ